MVLPKSNKNKKAIPKYIKAILLCPIILVSIQVLLVSTIYFHLNDKVETTVLNTVAETSIAIEQNIEKVEQKILSKFHNTAPETAKKVHIKLDSETKRKMYRQLYLTGKHGDIDIETMVKLAAETEDLQDVVNVTELPTQEDVFKMYGNKVMMEGEDTCEKFRELPFARRIIAPAGLFNTVSNK